jgi:DNA polymerase III subunit delta
MIFQSLEELEKDLQKSIECVYLLLGPEEYQCDKAYNLLRQNILTPEGVDFDCSVFIADQIPINEIIGSANIYPMISKRRLVVVHDAEKFKDADCETLLETLPNLSKRSTIVFTAHELDHRKKFYKTLREKYCVCEFQKLKDAALERWVENYLQKQGYRLASISIRKIVELIGSDLQSIASELDKLMLYAGETKLIPDAAIEDLVRASRQQGIFDFIGAVSQRDRNSALKSLANLLSMGEHPLVVVTMLARHFRQMLIAKESMQQGMNWRDIGAAAQIPPFILDKFLKQVKGVENSDIHDIYLRLATIDKQLKSSSLDGRILLESLVCALV